MPSANHIAFTAAINPPNTSPVLTRSQIWTGLERKILAGQDFVGGAIISTDIIRTYDDSVSGNPVTVREVVFREGNRRVQETCTAYEPTKVDFYQEKDGSVISNVVSEGAEGELYMTYVFEWRHPGVQANELEELREKEWKMAKVAVENTIVAMREIGKDGRIKG